MVALVLVMVVVKELVLKLTMIQVVHLQLLVPGQVLMIVLLMEWRQETS
jgi:hypothetical protein